MDAAKIDNFLKRPIWNSLSDDEKIIFHAFVNEYMENKKETYLAITFEDFLWYLRLSKPTEKQKKNKEHRKIIDLIELKIIQYDQELLKHHLNIFNTVK